MEIWGNPSVINQEEEEEEEEESRQTTRLPHSAQNGFWVWDKFRVLETSEKVVRFGPSRGPSKKWLKGFRTGTEFLLR
jgi:hypothetical protein